MASTFSTNLKIELMATGENAGTWGNITNTNLGTAIEQALVGYGAVSFAADANLTITLTNSNSAQAARALVLNVTSALSLSTTRELIVPTFQKQYIVQNNTTGGQSITVKTSAGTGITVPNGRKAHLYVDGTNVIHMFDFVDINGGTIDGVTIGGGTAGAGSFTTLSATGNVTLGDASTDTVTVNGYMGVGGAANSAYGLNVTSSALTGVGQWGIRSVAVATSASTSFVVGVGGTAGTAAASFTVGDVYNIYAGNSSKGAGSTITNQNGVYIADQTQGTNNYGITSLVSSGSNKWNIYASGTARNHMAGALSVGATTDPGTGGLYVAGNTTLGDASTDTVTVNGYMGIGGAPNSTFALNVLSTLTSGVNQRGIRVNITGNDTSTIAGISTSVATAASAFTVGNVSGVFLNDATKGAGSTITSQYGVYVSDQTQGTSNFGIASLVSSGSNKWNIYANGTASNYFAGQLQLNSTTLSSIGANSAIDVSNITSGTNASWRGLSMSTVDLGAATGNVGVYLSAPYASGTVNQAFFRVKRGAGSVYNGAEIAFNGAFRFLGSTVEDASERMRIDASGNVGIGTTTITERLHVEGRVSAGASSDRIVLGSSPLSLPTSDGNAYISWGASSVYGGTNGDLVLVPRTSAAASVRFYTGSGTPAERLRIDASGNVGLSVTPSAWGSSHRAVQGSSPSQVHFVAFNNSVAIGTNYYNDNTNFIYAFTGQNAARYDMTSAGVHRWFTAPSGTAGNAITFTQAMTLNASGNLGLGTTTPAYLLDIINDGNSFKAVRLRNADTGSSAYAGFIVNASGNSWAMRMGSAAANSNALEFPVDAAGTPIVRMSLTTSGNLGLGATIPTWNTGGNIVLQGTRYLSSVGSALGIVANGYFDTTDSRWEYTSTAAATWYNQSAGQHIWYNAASGTANTALTWTQAMTLNASGNLGIGTTVPATPLHVVGIIRSAAGTGGLLQLEDTDVADASTPFWTLQSDTGTFRVFSANRSGTGTTGSVERLRIDASGNVGIGTTSPAARLHVEKDGADIARFGDDFGNNVALTIENASGIAKIRYDQASDGAANKALAFFAGTNERMRIDSAGNVKIGGTADRATTAGTNQLVLFNGTAPVGTLTNGVSFYSATGEARVMDAAGNSTLLSPHDQSTNEWIFHSKHTPTGKVLRIDVERLLRFVNDHFGLDAVQEFIEN